MYMSVYIIESQWFPNRLIHWKRYLNLEKNTERKLYKCDITHHLLWNTYQLNGNRVYVTHTYIHGAVLLLLHCMEVCNCVYTHLVLIVMQAVSVTVYMCNGCYKYCIYPRTSTYIHSYIHTYIYICIYIPVCV